MPLGVERLAQGIAFSAAFSLGSHSGGRRLHLQSGPRDGRPCCAHHVRSRRLGEEPGDSCRRRGGLPCGTGNRPRALPGAAGSRQPRRFGPAGSRQPRRLGGVGDGLGAVPRLACVAHGDEAALAPPEPPLGVGFLPRASCACRRMFRCGRGAGTPRRPTGVSAFAALPAPAWRERAAAAGWRPLVYWAAAHLLSGRTAARPRGRVADVRLC